MAPGSLNPVSFFTHPQFQPATVVMVAGSATWYLRSARRTTIQGRTWASTRTLAFLLGDLVILVAATSGLAAFAVTNFTALAFFYLSLGLVGPGLIVLGAPLRLGELASVSREVPSVGGRLDSLLANRALRAVTFPALCWVIFTASAMAFFLTGLLGDSLDNLWVRQAVGVALVIVGLAFWWVVAGVDRATWRLGYWQRILYLILTFPVFGILGMTLQSERSRITPYTSLASLHLGAAVLWVAGETVALYATIAVFVEWLRNDERAAVIHDRDSQEVAARQLALWRASRDAAAQAQ